MTVAVAWSLPLCLDPFAHPGRPTVTDYWSKMDWPAYRESGTWRWTGAGTELSNEGLVVVGGWPLAALTSTCESAALRGGDGRVVAGLPVGGVWTFDDYHGWSIPRALGTQPIWHGLVVNTMFYATAVYVLICFASTSRGMMRKRRGLCVACAYPVAEGTCPECGTVVS